MSKMISGVRITAIFILLLLTCFTAVTLLDGGLAGAGMNRSAQADVVPAEKKSSLRLAAAAQGTDPRIIAVKPIQVLEDEPLILGKGTVVRVLVGSTATTTAPIEISASLTFDGQELEQTATLTQTEQYVDFYPEAPTELRTIEVSASIEPGEGVDDSDPDNNTMDVSVATIRMPEKPITLFYIPVDWSDQAREEAEFDTYFHKFVTDMSDFVRATYPLPDAQVIAEHTTVPHMLTPQERDLADEDFNASAAGILRFGGSVLLAAYDQSPDAELVVGVLPPHWFEQYYSPFALGVAFNAFPGSTFALLALTDNATIGHEYGHVRDLSDDYDYNPGRGLVGYPIDRPGFWVDQQRPMEISNTFAVYNMMAGAVSGNGYYHFWIDGRSYDHLVANYFSASAGGEVSEPLVLAATIVDPRYTSESGAPVFLAAGQSYWETDDTIGVTVATAGTDESDVIRVVWTRAGEIVAEEEQNSPGPEFAYTLFELESGGRDGHELGRYDVEVYLNEELVKTGRFFVQPAWLPKLTIPLGDNAPDNSEGYRGGSGVAPSTETQSSMFVSIASTSQDEIYSWFVAVADGNSEPREFEVDMKFIGPDGEEYAGTWEDDGEVRARTTLSANSYARKRLRIAGTDVAEQTGLWNVEVFVDGELVATNSFTLLDQSAGSAAATANTMLDQLGYRLIELEGRAAEGSTDVLTATLAMEPITTDLTSPEFIQQVWDGFAVVDRLYSGAGVYQIRMSVDERHRLTLQLSPADWQAIAEDQPSWDTLRDPESFVVRVHDDVVYNYLSEEDAVRFLEAKLE